ncbi:unnamed protein product [Coccothraustes coccothraustes]
MRPRGRRAPGAAPRRALGSSARYSQNRDPPPRATAASHRRHVRRNRAGTGPGPVIILFLAFPGNAGPGSQPFCVPCRNAFFTAPPTSGCAEPRWNRSRLVPGSGKPPEQDLGRMAPDEQPALWISHGICRA